MILFIQVIHQQKTFDTATEVQPLIASPILPQPLEFTKTVVEPVVIGLRVVDKVPGSR